MGADFIFAISKQCEDPDKAKNQIDQLPSDVLAEVAEHAFGEIPADDDVDGWQQVTDLLKEGIDIVYDADRRDLGTIYIDKPGVYVITGGMSWGDNPTEACPPMWALQNSGLEYN